MEPFIAVFLVPGGREEHKIPSTVILTSFPLVKVLSTKSVSSSDGWSGTIRRLAAG